MRVGNPSQDPLVLHSQWQIKLRYILLKQPDWNDIFISQWIKLLLESVIEADFSLPEELCDFVHQLSLALDSVRGDRSRIFLLLSLDFSQFLFDLLLG